MEGDDQGEQLRLVACRLRVLKDAAAEGLDLLHRRSMHAGGGTIHRRVQERRERQVVRAADLIAFGHSGCRDGLCEEHVIGFVGHERRRPDVGRRAAAGGRCQPAHSIHSLNERGHGEIGAVC